jgi:hypothetical protein
MFEYEHTSKYSAFETREQLLKEIDGDDFHLSPIQGKITLNKLERILDSNEGKSIEFLQSEFINQTDSQFHSLLNEMFSEIAKFITTIPRLPDMEKEYASEDRLKIEVDDSREKIITRIKKFAKKHETGLLSLYVFRDMDSIDWEPFIKAALERNPVSFSAFEKCSSEVIYEKIKSLNNESIYDGKRMALPDEVWNFGTGDGCEKALLMADILHHQDPAAEITIDIANKNVTLRHNKSEFNFSSKKGFNRFITISDNDYSVVIK